MNAGLLWFPWLLVRLESGGFPVFRGGGPLAQTLWPGVGSGAAGGPVGWWSGRPQLGLGEDRVWRQGWLLEG